MNRFLLGVVLVAGCQYRDDVVQPAPAVAQKPTSVEPAAADGEISGTVVETMNASSYTYARLDRGGTEIWVAGPQAALAVGTKLTKLEGQLMTDFHSSTLDRTFPRIYFVTSLGAPAPAAGAAPAPAADPGGAVSGTVVETMDAAGYTYALIDQGGTKTWVAGPTTKLAVGTKLAGMSGSLMTAFHSNTLNRTFDQIYFVGSYNLVP
jgi:hypothetical protein